MAARSIRVISLAACMVASASLVASAAAPAADTVTPAAQTPARILSGVHPYGISLALDAAGRRYIAASSRDGALWYATDRSGSWVTAKVLDGPTNPGDWAWVEPSIATDTDGSVHIAVVRATVDATPGSTNGISYITDKGRPSGDFGPRTRITNAGMTSPSLRVVEGVRYLAYTRCACSPGDRTAPLYFRTDRSGSWQVEKIAPYATLPSLRVATNGRAQIAYGDRKGLRWTQARSRMGDFTAPARIPGSLKGSGVSLALDTSDRPHVSWVATGSGRDVIQYSRRVAGEWSTPKDLGPGFLTQLSLDSQDRPHVLFARDDQGGKLVHRWRAAGVWQRSTISRGERISSIAIRAFGTHASIAWSQLTKPRGVFLTRD
jgi:hypothetical protein